jgi:hypothetical protein
VTQRLIRLAREHWVTLDGDAALLGLDLLALPFDRFLNAVYRFATKDANPDAVRSFDARLWIPPRGVVPTRGPWSPEAETNAFLGLKNALGMKGTASPPS